MLEVKEKLDMRNVCEYLLYRMAADDSMAVDPKQRLTFDALLEHDAFRFCLPIDYMYVVVVLETKR